MASLRTPPQDPCYSEKKNFHWIHGFLGYNKEPSLEENRAKKPIWRSHKLFPSRSRLKKFTNKISRWTSQMAGQSLTIQQNMQKMQQTVSSPGSLPIQKKNATNKSSENQSHQFFASEMNKKTRTLLGFWTPLTDPKSPKLRCAVFFQIVAWCFELATCCRDDDSQKVLLMKRWWIIYSETCPSYYKTFA